MKRIYVFSYCNAFRVYYFMSYFLKFGCLLRKFCLHYMTLKEQFSPRGEVEKYIPAFIYFRKDGSLVLTTTG